MLQQRECTSVRYEYLVDPCDWYIIWDNVLDLPAMAGGEILAFSTEQRAATVAELLNRAHRVGDLCLGVNFPAVAANHGILSSRPASVG